MKATLKIIALVLALYLMASAIFSVAHANADSPWNFRQNRNGLLCAEFVEHDNGNWEFVVYSPFCNWADVFLFGVCYEDGEWYTFSDGFYNFGEW